jgi:sulfide:quinone oxidoreductase
MVSRRRFLQTLALGGTALAIPSVASVGTAAPIKTKARIVIVGAGAGGTSLVNRLVRRLEGASITIVDPRAEHVYQPGLSLVAAGLRPESYVVSMTRDWLPADVELVEKGATAVDPVAKTVSLDDGATLPYDFLVLAPGLVLDHDAIEGFSLDLVGTNGVGALYAGPDHAARTWQAASRFAETGGVGLFTRPATEMKCAGAPLKHTFLIDDIARRGSAGSRAKIVYASNSSVLFGVPIVSEKVRMLFHERSIDTLYDHVLKRLDPVRRIATFQTEGGLVEHGYDYIHVIPPQRAPEFVRQSDLSWADKWTDQGWVEVDQQTLRHRRYREPACPVRLENGDQVTVGSTELMPKCLH